MKKGILILLVISLFLDVYSQTGIDLAKEMVATCKSFKTLSFTLEKEERIKGKMKGDKAFNKIQISPKKIYHKQEYPKEGLEFLYLEGQNDNKALINTNGFPWVNVSLEPYGSQMRENQHHTLHKLGFESMADILGHLLDKYEEQSENMIQITGSTTWDGRDCYVLKMENPNFVYEQYVVKAGENLIDIAQARQLSEHMILEANKHMDFYYDVRPNQIIKIPGDYAKSMELYLDKTRKIPLMIKVYDDKGLYEHYKYYDVSINPTFTNEDFSSENSKYGF